MEDFDRLLAAKHNLLDLRCISLFYLCRWRMGEDNDSLIKVVEKVGILFILHARLTNQIEWD